MMNYENVVNWIPMVISFGALIFSIMQFFCERTRNRKEATIHAFDALESNEAILYLFSLSKKQINLLVNARKEKNHAQIKKKWNELKKALPLIEHFAVGINSGVYDIYTLHRMAGNKMIDTFHKCENLINYKRNGNANQNNYVEFETMVNKLIKLRK